MPVGDSKQKQQHAVFYTNINKKTISMKYFYNMFVKLISLY